MSNLTELTEKLRQKDSEKSSIEQEIDEITGYQNEGFIGKLRLHYIEARPVDLMDDMVLEMSSDTGKDLLSASSIIIQSSNHGEVLLKQRDMTIVIDLKDPSAAKEVIELPLRASFNTSEIPDDIASKFELELNNGNTSAIVTLMVSFDSLDELVQSKAIQLNQTLGAIDDLRTLVKDASKKKDPETTTVKKTKKSGVSKGLKEKKPKKKAVVEDVDSRDDEVVNKTSDLMESATRASQWMLQVVIEKRSYAIFCVAAAGIYYFGEYASV